MKLKNNKRIVIINTIAIFLTMFLFSNIYKWIPNFLTASLFPVNESLFEHLKLMYVTQIIVSLIVYMFLKSKNIKVNNYFLGLLLSTIFTILLFFLIYIPLYSRIGENLIVTMLLYLVVLIIGEYVFYLIMSKFKNLSFYNTISLLVIALTWLILIYLTFTPPHTEFFFDPISEIYGIPSNNQ